jgi:TfoX/Sxy family transcriptional regulator of competence genes
VPDPATRERVLDVLKPLGPVMARPALGGTGLQLNGSLFGVLHSGLIYLNVDKGLREDYHAAGMRSLEPRPKQKLDAFLQVPQAVVDDAATLLEHAARAAGRPLPKAVAPVPEPEATPAGESTEKPAPKRSSAGERAKTAAPRKAKASAEADQASKPARTARGKAEKTSS